MTPAAVKHLGLVARRDDLSRAGFVRHWTEVHAPMVARLPGLLRYSVNLAERVPGFEFDGIAELWFASWPDLEAAFASPEAAALADDVPRFVGRHVAVRCEERRVVWPREPARGTEPLPRAADGRPRGSATGPSSPPRARTASAASLPSALGAAAAG